MTKDIQQLAQELATQIKTEKDLNEFSGFCRINKFQTSFSTGIIH